MSNLSNLINTIRDLFLELKRPGQILQYEANTDFESSLYNEFINLEREDITQFTAGVILQDSDSFTDLAFLYFLPSLLDNLSINTKTITSISKRTNNISIADSDSLSALIIDLKYSLELIKQQIGHQ
jgi:hypothetical protein